MPIAVLIKPAGASDVDANANWFGLRAPFFLLAALLACALPTVIRMRVPSVPGDSPKNALRILLRSRGIRAGLLLGATLYVPIGVYDSLWARFLEDRGATRLFVAFSLTIFAAPIALLAPLGGRLADRFGPLRLGATCAVCTVPFVVAFVNEQFPASDRAALQQALLSVGSVPDLCIAMETKNGFVPFETGKKK